MPPPKGSLSGLPLITLTLLMANIPVEKTATGTPWWLWLLGALLLAALLWFLISALGDDDDDVVVADPVETVDPAPVEALPPATATALDMSNLYVTRVTGDRTFFVSASETDTANETLVILDQEPSPDVAGIEGQVDINPGQRVSLSQGRMEPLGDMNLAGMGLSDADASSITSTTDVIRVSGENVDILEAPMGEDAVEVGT